MRSRTRRDALRLGAAALSAVATGCLEASGGRVPREAGTTADPATTEPQFTLPQPSTSAAPDDPTPLGVGSEWPRYQFDASNAGHERGTTALPTEPALYWQFYVRSTPPTVADGRLFTAESGPDSRRAVCRDAATGRLVWTERLDGAAAGAPTVAGSRVFVQTRRTLLALDRATGDRLWRTDVGRGVPGAPAVVDGVVYCCSGARESQPTTVFAVDAETGSRRWAVELEGSVPGSLAVAGDTVFVATAGVDVDADTAADDTGRLHALDTVAGGERWQVDLGSPATGSPLVARGMLFVPTRSRLQSYWTDDGRVHWSTRVGRITGDAPAFAGDSVYVGSEHGLHAIKWATGSELWRYETGAPATTPVVGQEAVYVGERAGERPAVLAVGRDDGTERWRRETGALEAGTRRRAGVTGPPTPVAGGVYAVAADGMYAFGPADGASGTTTDATSGANGSTPWTTPGSASGTES